MKAEKLSDFLGRKETYPLEKGSITTHPFSGEQVRILEKYKDFLGNERILTNKARKHVEEAISKEDRQWRKEARKWGLQNIAKILQEPDFIFLDTLMGAILYVKKRTIKKTIKLIAVVVGRESKHYIYTVEPIAYPPQGLESGRYKLLYNREEALSHERKNGKA